MRAARRARSWRSSLFLIGVGLVGRQRGGVESQRIEHRGFTVLGVAQIDLLHRLLVGDGAGAVVEFVIVAVEGRDRRDVVLLPLGLRRRRHRLCDRLGAGLQGGWARRIPQRVPVAHRDAPIADRAVGLGFGDRGEVFQRLGIPERVQGPYRVLEGVLHGRTAGGRKVDLLDDLRPGVRPRRGLEWQRKQRSGGENHRNSTVRHGDILPESVRELVRP
jgi:hypothetical protein